jgi:hypothetical protein
VSDEPISQDKINDLVTKLKATSNLDADQKALLDAMITMVSQLTKIQKSGLPPALPPVAGSFSPGAAKIVLDYANPDADVESRGKVRSHVVHYITR